MRGSFSMFIRRRIGLVVVITFAANVIMFSAIHSFTGNIPSEQPSFVHTVGNTSPNYNEKEVGRMNMEMQTENMKMNGKKRIKNSKQHNRKTYSNDKGQMDYVPPERMVNTGNNTGVNNKLLYQKFLNQTEVLPPNKIASESRKINAIKHINALANANNSKVHHPYDDKVAAEEVHYEQNVAAGKSIHKENHKVPNTFNEEYIKYFWRHPEFQKGNNVRVIQGEFSEVGKTYDKIDKVKHRELDNTVDRKADNYRDLKGIHGDIKIVDGFQQHQSNHKVDTLKEANEHTNKTKDYHENSEHKKEVRNSGDPHENLLKRNEFSDKKTEPARTSEGMNQQKDKSYMTMFPANGQLGNQMFQLASLLGIAERGNFTPFLSTSIFEMNKVFRFPKGLSRDIDISTFQNFSDYNYTQNISIKLSQKLDIHRNWTLDGYFQSFKYFSHVSDKVRKYLRFHKHLLQAASEFMQRTVPVGNIKIAIHIRRGDFISSYQMWLGRLAATPEYVKRATQYFQSRYDNITFIVVSDDMKWCKQHIKGDNVVYQYNEKGVDLAIISQCDHVIISVGTFGWWGGWLSGGTVVYYNKFPRPGSKLDEIFMPENYYPSDWIGLE